MDFVIYVLLPSSSFDALKFMYFLHAIVTELFSRLHNEVNPLMVNEWTSWDISVSSGPWISSSLHSYDSCGKWLSFLFIFIMSCSYQGLLSVLVCLLKDVRACMFVSLLTHQNLLSGNIQVSLICQLEVMQLS